MVPHYSLWRNSITGVTFAVAADRQSKTVSSGVVLTLDKYFLEVNYGATAAVVAQANTSDLRAWLDSI